MTWRKFFHWGIVFWLLVWMASVCCLQAINGRTIIKKVGLIYASGSFNVIVGDGAVSLIPFEGPMSWPTNLEWEHMELWSPSQLKLIRNYPEILIAKLGKLGVMKRGSRTQVSFPIAGFLWVWLAAGLYGEMKLLKHPLAIPDVSAAVVGSRKRVTMLVGTMLVLSAIIATADRMSRQVEDAKTCVRHLATIRYNINRAAVGEPIAWNEIFANLDRYVKGNRNCPCGEPYILPAVKPPAGEPPVQCSRDDHRRYLAGVSGP